MNPQTLQRREHYLDVAGPVDWSDTEVARWLFALALRRDGRTDGITRAGEIVPRRLDEEPMAELAPRERGAFACAMYVAWSASGALDWPLMRVSRAFGVLQSWAIEVIVATSADASGSPAFRAGLADIDRAVRAALIERGRG